MFTICSILLACMSFVVPVVKAPDFTVGQSYNSQGTWRAFAKSGRVQMTEREIHVQFLDLVGRQRDSAVVVLFDPHSRLYTWQVYNAFPDNGKPQFLSPEVPTRACYVGNDEIVDFYVEFKSLQIRAFKATARDIDDASQQSLQQLRVMLQTDGESKSWAGLIKIGIPALDTDFLSPGTSAAFSSVAKISEIEWDGKNWSMTIEGGRTLKIGLDSHFQFLGSSETSR